ncbi:MAG TPA: hypothetical protein VHS05_21905, partial [Pyrinomonadaceae bacterium]|nr:hypothetical protein [Pyrinomonadaceae bacterium]
MKSHSILDAAGHIQVLGLGVYDPFPSSERKSNGKERRVTYHMPQLPDATGRLRGGSLRQRSYVFD